MNIIAHKLWCDNELTFVKAPKYHIPCKLHILENTKYTGNVQPKVGANC